MPVLDDGDVLVPVGGALSLALVTPWDVTGAVVRVPLLWPEALAAPEPAGPADPPALAEPPAAEPLAPE